MSSEGSAGRSTYRDRLQAKIALYTPADRDEVVRTRTAMYGERSFLSKAEYLAWMYERAPGVGGAPSPLWLFRSNDELQGQQGGVRTILRVQGEDYEALWATDLFVKPTYQLRGVGAVLSEQVRASAPVTMGIEVSEAARQGFRRAGWSDLGDVPLYVRPLDVARLADMRDRSLPHGFAPALNSATRGVDWAASAALRASGIRLVEVTEFDSRADEVWAASSGYYAVIAHREATTLNWRFVDFPVKGLYRLFYLQRGGRVKGYAVIRVAEHGGINSAWLVDFLCPPRWTFPLLMSSIDVARRSGVEALYCIKERGRLAKSFTAAGFLRRSTGWPLMVSADGLPDGISAALKDPGQWFLTAGDSNVDYPREGTEYIS